MMFPGISEYLIIKKRFHKAVGRNYASATGRGDRSDPIGIMLDEGDELSVFQPGSPDVAGANIATSFYPGILVHWSRLQMLELLQFWKQRRSWRRVLRRLVRLNLGKPPSVARRPRQTAI